MHKVQPKETLFSLYRAYGVQMDVIKRLNPALREGLKIGMFIYIPFKENAELTRKERKIMKKEDKAHVVSAGETLYSLSKKYGTTVARLKKLNPHITNTLSIGTILKLPVSKESIIPIDTIAVDTIAVDTLQKGSAWIPDSILYPIDTLSNWDDDSSATRIAYMLPLFLNVLDSMELNRDSLKLEEHFVPAESRYALEFLEGATMALEELKKKGYKLETRFF